MGGTEPSHNHIPSLLFSLCSSLLHFLLLDSKMSQSSDTDAVNYEVDFYLEDDMFGFAVCLSSPKGCNESVSQFMDVMDVIPTVSALRPNKETTSQHLLNTLKEAHRIMRSNGNGYIRNYHRLCRYFIFYYSGNGGCDADGSTYLLLADQKKVYIKEIVEMLSPDKVKKIDYILFFELSPGDDGHAKGSPKLPPTPDGFVVAMSGLRSSGIGWTTALVGSLMQSISLKEDLINLKKQFDMEYVYRAGYIALHGTNFLAITKDIGDTKKGIMITASSSSKTIDFEYDKKSITTICESLEFQACDSMTIGQDDSDYKAEASYATNLTAAISAISQFKFSMYTVFLSLYYSGYGGVEEGRLYLKPGEGDVKYYVDWIVSLFSQRFNADMSCLIFLELCLPDDHPDVPPTLHLTASSNMIVAVSGLHKASVGRSSQGGKWTKKLCESLMKSKKLPLTDVLDSIGAELPELEAHYISSARPIYIDKEGKLDFSDPTKEASLPKESIMPTVDNVYKLLNDIGVAHEWENIGRKLRLSQGTLDDISAAGSSEELSFKKMIKKAIAKITDWSVLRAAVENSIGRDKAEELMIKLGEM